MRTIQLLEGQNRGFRWAITLEIYPTGGFKAKGRIRTWFDRMYNKNTMKHSIRHSDRQWFIYHLGKEYMIGKEVHHSWGEETKCYLLSPKEHRKRHYG